MEVALACECGAKVTVHEGMSGLSVLCACGRTITIPDYRELRRLQLENIPENAITSPPVHEDYQQAPAVALFVLVMVIFAASSCIVISVSFVHAGVIAGIGACLICVSQIWLFSLIYSGNPFAGLVLILVPIVGPITALRFFFDHFAVAVWPFLCVISGLALFYYGLFVT